MGFGNVSCGRTDTKERRAVSFHSAIDKKKRHTLEDEVVEGGADKVPLLVAVGAA